VIADITKARIIAGVYEGMATERALVIAPRRDPPG
jgi:hypothetical protein